ncbi:uncharacterized protein LOC143553167 [Bidens hawaiensis]|uniref:uncharacterized protein LOC143553167 n=1 Tax=Bidens hawaiensis TaxID=980011 RepID=UPI00404B02AD
MSDSTANRTTTAAVQPSSAMANELLNEDTILSNSELLSREEVLKRRSRRLKQLTRVYKDHYWNMMEELKVQYRKYYWKYGKSPYQENEPDGANVNVKNGDGDVDGVDEELRLELSNGWSRCVVHGCKFKAMALTKFCYGHILSDPKQKLYVKCDYVIKSSQAGPLICGKPVLKNTVPCLCVGHYQKAEKHVSRALKKAGLNVSSTNKVAPKFHILIAESIRQIQSSRRIADKEMKENLELKEEEISI